MKVRAANPYAPAHLFVGSRTQLENFTHHFLQQQWCANTACGSCMVCQQVAKHQYESLVWITPKKWYTLDDLEPVFERISLSSEAHTRTYIVLEHAEQLTTVCGNKLLKSVEEPPTGYHFVFLTSRPNALLQTIQSRCLKTIVSETSHSTDHPIFKAFIARTPIPAAQFSRMLDDSRITEAETTIILDALIDWWNKQQIHTPSHAKQYLTVLTNAYHRLPMSGSSKMFWKNLFLLQQSRTH